MHAAPHLHVRERSKSLSMFECTPFSVLYLCRCFSITSDLRTMYDGELVDDKSRADQRESFDVPRGECLGG
jgi:hypothetical protein